MRLRQAIVRSYRSRSSHKKAQLACSPGISDSIADSICDWSPGHDDLIFGQNGSINFFWLTDDIAAISRTTIGSLEKTHRQPDAASRHVVSHIAILTRTQLERYDNNVVQLFNTMRSMGMLLLQTSVPNELPDLDLPDEPFFYSSGITTSEENRRAEQLRRAIDIHGQVVIVGLEDPLEFLGSYLATVPVGERASLSFSTGMCVDQDRPFTLQFFRETDPVLDKEFASHQLRMIDFNLEHVPLN